MMYFIKPTDYGHASVVDGYTNFDLLDDDGLMLMGGCVQKISLDFLLSLSREVQDEFAIARERERDQRVLMSE